MGRYLAAYRDSGYDPSTDGGSSFSEDAGDFVLDAARDWLGGASRRGGADPCCPPGYDPSGTWPRNSGEGGAPPDYRTRGAPMEDDSPSGVGRLKDDFCDCIPISYGGRYWALGVVKDGTVFPGPVESADLDDAVWVNVSPAGTPLAVPGYGDVRPPGTSGGGSGGSGGWAPTDPGIGFTTSAAVPALLALGLLGAAWYARK